MKSLILLLHNHGANFKRTWHKSSLSEEVSQMKVSANKDPSILKKELIGFSPSNQCYDNVLASLKYVH